MSAVAMDEQALIEGLHAGDERALAEFVARYRPALERIAAGAIAPDFRKRVGPETVAQSVCRTFLRRMESDPYELSDAGALWRLLCAIALTKVREKVRFHRRDRRAVDQEVPLDAARDLPVAETVGPDTVVAFHEALEQVLLEIDEEERAILEHRLEGRTQGEIAAALGCSERTVRRLLGGLETKLRRRLE